MKKADHRTIYSLVDFDGNSGKSSYYKYLYINDPINIGRLSYGTGSQLRSAAINMGKKNCYIIDLPRTKSRADNHDDLVSVIEELKSGSVFSPMYGRNAHLIMQPPIIIISSNFVLEGTSLSKDRWQVYEILKDKKLGKKNRLLSVNNIKKKVKKSEWVLLKYHGLY